MPRRADRRRTPPRGIWARPSDRDSPRSAPCLPTGNAAAPGPPVQPPSELPVGCSGKADRPGNPGSPGAGSNLSLRPDRNAELRDVGCRLGAPPSSRSGCNSSMSAPASPGSCRPLPVGRLGPPRAGPSRPTSAPVVRPGRRPSLVPVRPTARLPAHPAPRATSGTAGIAPAKQANRAIDAAAPIRGRTLRRVRGGGRGFGQAGVNNGVNNGRPRPDATATGRPRGGP
jgi:hypothetical protein